MGDAGTANERLKKLRARFEKGGAAPTPENQFGQIKKSQKAQMKAIKLAKARAARYNMTLRSLAIKSNMKMGKDMESHRKAQIEARKRAAKYNATARAVRVGSTGAVNQKDKINIGKALNDKMSPPVAKKILEAVAKKNSLASAPKTQAAIVTPAPQKQGTPVETEDVAPVKVEMKEVSEALKQGDKEALNKAILTSFIDSSAPHLKGKEELLLEKFSGQLQKLFDTLLMAVPDPGDAAIAGRNKADKEIVESMEGEEEAVAPAEPKVSEKEVAVKKVSMEKPEELSPLHPTLLEEGGDGDADSSDGENSLVAMEDDNPTDMAGVLSPATEAKMARQQDEEYALSYEELIKQAEEDPETQKEESLRRRQTVKDIDADALEELKQYDEENTAAEKKQSMMSDESDDSMVRQEKPTEFEEQYILEAELKPAGTDGELGQWAVSMGGTDEEFQNRLMKIGFKGEEAQNFLENIDEHTSGML